MYPKVAPRPHRLHTVARAPSLNLENESATPGDGG